MKFERPLQEKEISVLHEQLRAIDKGVGRQVRFLFVWTVLALIAGVYAYSKMRSEGDRILLFTTIAVYIGIGAWVVAEMRYKDRRKKESIAYLINKNLVTVAEVRSGKYIELEEEDDEGVYYLYQLDNDTVFSFGGQDHFYPDDKFPSDHFEIVEGRGMKNEVILFELYNYGRKTLPAAVIKGKEKWKMLERPAYPDPHSLTIAKGRLEDFIPAQGR